MSSPGRNPGEAGPPYNPESDPERVDPFRVERNLLLVPCTTGFTRGYSRCPPLGGMTKARSHFATISEYGYRSRLEVGVPRTCVRRSVFLAQSKGPKQAVELHGTDLSKLRSVAPVLPFQLQNSNRITPDSRPKVQKAEFHTLVYFVPGCKFESWVSMNSSRFLICESASRAFCSSPSWSIQQMFSD